jgi:hypothetical protein
VQLTLPAGVADEPLPGETTIEIGYGCPNGIEPGPAIAVVDAAWVIVTVTTALVLDRSFESPEYAAVNVYVPGVTNAEVFRLAAPPWPVVAQYCVRIKGPTVLLSSI